MCVKCLDIDEKNVDVPSKPTLVPNLTLFEKKFKVRNIFKVHCHTSHTYVHIYCYIKVGCPVRVTNLSILITLFLSFALTMQRNRETNKS